MSYHLGIDLGTTYTAAAVWRDGQVSISELGGRAAPIPSVVFLREDETILAGEAADRRGLSEPDRVAREFKRRIGDPTPLMVGGVPYSADRLATKLLRWVVEHVAEREGGQPASIAVTHPANWGPFKQDLIEQAIRNADLQNVTTLTEPEAAAIYYSSLERVEPGSILGVYDLGGGTFDAALLRKTPDGFEILGRPDGIERLGGIDFDEAVFAHVRMALGGAIDELDPDGPAAIAAVGRLRRDCMEAKEALSADTEAVIPVMLPGIQTEVRITRTEFEAMIRPSLVETIDAMRRTIRSADIAPEDVTSILLIGGSSRIPLVAQMVAAELGRPISLDVHPKHAIPLGAAIVAAQSASAIAPPLGAGAAVGAVAVSDTPPEPTESPEPEVVASGSEPSPIAEKESSETRSRIPLGLVAAIAAVAVIVVGGGFLALRDRGDGTTVAAVTTSTQPADTTSDTTAPPATVGSDAVTTTTLPPTTTSSTTTMTMPLLTDVEHARILAVDVLDATYVVSYDANFDPIISSNASSHHLHFFWDVYDPSTVGTNEPQATRSPWHIWDKDAEGRLVFDGWTVGDRPSGASAICVVPATPNHQVANIDRVDEISNCMPLPKLEASEPAWTALQPGDCVTTESGLGQGPVDDLYLSSCLVPHDGEIYVVGSYEEGPWPGLVPVALAADNGCIAEFSDYVGVEPRDSLLSYDTLTPTEDSWANGDRTFLCVLFAEDQELVGPVAGQGI